MLALRRVALQLVVVELRNRPLAVLGAAEGMQQVVDNVARMRVLGRNHHAGRLPAAAQRGVPSSPGSSLRM